MPVPKIGQAIWQLFESELAKEFGPMEIGGGGVDRCPAKEMRLRTP